MKHGPRTPPSPGHEAMSTESPRDNRKRRKTPPRDAGDAIGYATPPKRSRRDRGTASPSVRDRDYREPIRAKSGRDRDYRESDRYDDRKQRSPRYINSIRLYRRVALLLKR